jgi:hypothetical protein
MDINEDELNISIRKFLKLVGITSQREIENSIRKAVDDGRINGDKTIKAKITLELDGVSEPLKIQGELNVRRSE